MKSIDKSWIPVIDLMLKMQDITLEDLQKNGGKLRFSVRINEELMQADITELDLSQRSFNCLRRAKYDTVGELVLGIYNEDDLLKIHSLGKRSAGEIMRKVFLYQYMKMDEAQKRKYAEKVQGLNSGRMFTEE